MKALRFIGPLLAALLLASVAGQAAVFNCPVYTAPVVRLDFGSRYSVTSENRALLDPDRDQRVTQALGPIDDFINDLARESAAALGNGQHRAARAACALAAIETWAKADALADLQSPQARLVSPSRLGGIAMVYALLRPLSQNPQRTRDIDNWLNRRAAKMTLYFDTQAPPDAARNNLRAWAGLAATRIGLTTGDKSLLDWGADAARRVACQALPDGSLPLEMQRGKFALHYQMHALGPLVATAALLAPTGIDLFATCDHAIERAADFVAMAFADPMLTTRWAGVRQSYFTGKEQLQGFELAWITALSRHAPQPALSDLAAPFQPLTHTKLGGNQALVWTTFEQPGWQPNIVTDAMTILTRHSKTGTVRHAPLN